MKLRSDFLIIVGLFLVWRFLLLILSFVAPQIPLNYADKFLGGGVSYNLLPQLYGWANFDGEHYLSIAIIGYKGLEQAFFPIYPSLMGVFAGFVQNDFFLQQLVAVVAGLTLSHLFFLLSLVLLWDLVRIDYSKEIAYLTLISILTFPTSFYFAAVYSESIFLFFCLSSFYLMRTKSWVLANLVGGFSSAVRIFGIILFPAFLIEAWQQKMPLKKILWIFLVPVGLFCYMLYQYLTVGDPLAFYNLQKIVGEQHQSGITLLPQVYIRYIKILFTTPFSNPIYQTMVLEFTTGVVFFLLPIYGYFKKMRLSYVVFALLSFLMPSLQGSFSSVPRYLLVFFPSFIALAIFLSRAPKFTKYGYFIFSSIWLSIQTVLFLRGYWIA